MPATQTVSLDFETASGIDLIKTGVYRYAEDLTTFVRCVAFYDPELGAVTSFSPSAGSVEQRRLMTLAENPNVLFRAWNAQFERVIWNTLCSPRLGWPVIALPRWRCSLVEAAAMALPHRLDKAGAALGVTQQKDMTGHRLMLKMSRPKGWSGDAPDFDQDEERQAQLMAYCEQDVRSEMAIKELIPDLPSRELAMYHLDQAINDRGIAIDKPLVRQLFALYKDAQAQAAATITEATDGAVTAATQNQALMEWLNAQGVHTNSVAKAAVEGLLAKDTLPAIVRTTLEARQMAAKSSLAKAEAFLNARSHGDRVRGTMQFHGADTGRWAGRLIQPQNMPARSPRVPPDADLEPVCDLLKAGNLLTLDALYPVMDVAPLALRPCFVASEGKNLVWADFGQIEARTVAWLAGEQWLLDLFASHGKVYEEMASSIFHRPAASFGKHSRERQLAKMAVLGCGFGMGAKRFFESVTTAGIRLSPDEAETIVRAYRQRNAKIVAFWRDLDRAAVRAVKNPGERVELRHGLTFVVKDRWLRVILPSKRRALAYYMPEVVDSTTPWGSVVPAVEVYRSTGANKAWMRIELCGTFMAENITQAVARDLLAEGIERADATPGLSPVFHVHDELICETDLSREAARAKLATVMCASRNWADGLPVEVDTAFAGRYLK